MSVRTKGEITMKIVENGIPLCGIFVPENPSQVELHSAKQLQKYLRKISGATFSTKTGFPPKGPAICIAERNHVDFEQAKNMAPESIIRLVDNERLFLIGGDARGVIVGVYDFLHKLGCIFAQPEIEFIVEKSTIEISEKFYYHEPFMETRYVLGGGNMKMFDWCAKVGMSHSPQPQLRETPEFQGEKELLSEEVARLWAKQAIELRGEKGIFVGGHVCESIMPPSKYFDQHPEYFAYNPEQKPDALHKMKNGRDSFGICWTHPEVKKIFIRYFLDFFRKFPYVKRFTFFPNDGQPPCFCDNCIKIEKPWQGITTKQLQYTKNYVLFASDIAKEIAKEFPDVIIEVGSYDGHTELPEDFSEQLPENLGVIFCIYERKWDRALDDPPTEEELKKTLAQTTVSSYEKDAIKYTIYPEIFRKWKKHIRGPIRYYDYLTSTLGSMAMLFPVSAGSIRTIRFLKQQGFEGYGTQWFDSPAIWASYGLSLYVTSLAMWDRNATWEELSKEYCLALFRNAAKPMFEYYEILENSARNVRFGMGIPEILQVFDNYTYQQCKQKIKQALEMAGSNKRIRKRIKDQLVLLEFGHLFWLTREIEKEIEMYLKQDRIDECFLLVSRHAKIDNRIQKLFNYPLLSVYKKWRGILYRHILGSISDRRGLLYAIQLLKDATNAKFHNLWYKE